METTPTALAQTAAEAESTLDIASIKAMLDGFDPAALLPDLEKLLAFLPALCRFAVMIGPIAALLLGLGYLIFSPKEANYYFGYRCYFGMGSVYAWRFTQRLAGALFTLLGLGLTAAMFMVSAGFAALDPQTMAWRALLCVAIQAGLALFVVLTINLSAALRFNRKGNHRRKRG